jgi:hypothetical protein
MRPNHQLDITYSNVPRAYLFRAVTLQRFSVGERFSAGVDVFKEPQHDFPGLQAVARQWKVYLLDHDGVLDLDYVTWHPQPEGIEVIEVVPSVAEHEGM